MSNHSVDTRSQADSLRLTSPFGAFDHNKYSALGSCAVSLVVVVAVVMTVVAVIWGGGY